EPDLSGGPHKIPKLCTPRALRRRKSCGRLLLGAALRCPPFTPGGRLWTFRRYVLPELPELPESHSGRRNRPRTVLTISRKSVRPGRFFRCPTHHRRMLLASARSLLSRCFLVASASRNAASVVILIQSCFNGAPCFACSSSADRRGFVIDL